MPTPLTIRLHPTDLAAGVALITTAARATLLPTGGVLAAWDYSHAMAPQEPREAAIAEMLGAVARTLAGSCSCFRFRATRRGIEPGLVPAVTPRRRDSVRLRFEPALEALSRAVSPQGAFGLLVTNGLRTMFQRDTTPFFHPGILRLCPQVDGRFCPQADGLYEDDAFLGLGYPTLVVSTQIPRDSLSAHEILDLCATLGAKMAEDLRALPSRAAPSP